MAFSKWEHIFSKGEYPSRERLLSGLTLDQVTTLPKGMSHSIYEELWHIVTWQDIVITNDDSKYKSWEEGNRFPLNRPETINEWNELVGKFQSGLNEIFKHASNPETLKFEPEPGVTIEDCFNSLAVHNAVHFGKILALRQMIGAWPPVENQN